MDYRTLDRVAYDYLKEKILGREFSFETIYSETKLANELSISRTPIRDALNRLASERYIDILPSRGFRLHKPNSADIHEAYHVRIMIEVYCGRILAKDIHKKRALAMTDRMEQALERQKALIDSPESSDLLQFWTDDLEFHHAPLDYMNISAFNTQYDIFLHIFMPQHLADDFVLGRKHSTIAEHTAILAALRSGDPDETEAVIRRHADTSLRLSMINTDT